MKAHLSALTLLGLSTFGGVSADCLHKSCIDTNQFVKCAQDFFGRDQPGHRPTTTAAAAPTATAKPVVYEAEDSVLGGPTIQSSLTGYSGTGYVGQFANEEDNIRFIIPSDTVALYNVQITYQAPYGDKKTRMVVNDASSSSEITLTQNAGKFSTVDAGKVLLQPGNNTIQLQRDWGWYFIDSLSITPAARRGPHNLSPCLANVKSSQWTWDLWSMLQGFYGNKILSGQQDPAMLSWMEDWVGRDPAILGLDMIDYSPSRAAHGLNSTAVEDAIAWDLRGGIVDFVWHWNAPAGIYDVPGKEWWRGFYTIGTDFNLTTALDPQNANYTLLIRDMDVIASKLDQLSDAHIPVLWRPLHEAEGGWFWWGAQGPAACKALYRLMYDRFTNHWDLKNLIWVWNSVSPDWYPGDDVVDIVSYDSYPRAGDHGVVDSQYKALLNLGQDRKVIAMAENGPIPDPALLSVYQADWSYFVTWGGEYLTDGKQNSLDFLQYVYNHSYVLTLDQIAGWKRGWKMPNKSTPWVMSPRLTPSPSPSPTPAPTSSVAYPIPSPTQVIHRGSGLSNGYQSWSWDVTVDLNSVAVAPPQMDSVTSSIFFNVTAKWGALSLHTGTSFVGYKTFHFQAQGSPNFIFAASTDGGASSRHQALSTICTPAVSVGAWSNCVVDLQALGANSWTKLNLQASTDQLGLSLYVADLYLEGQAVF